MHQRVPSQFDSEARPARYCHKLSSLLTWPSCLRVIGVEIEEAISQLADQSFDPGNFPYAFLEAFGNKETTTKRLAYRGLEQV